MLKSFFYILYHSTEQGLKKGGRLWIATLFFLVCVSLVPLGIAPDSASLKPYGAGMIWIFALLSALLGLEDLFSEELKDGRLELYLLQPLPLSLVILARLTAHWLQMIIPLMIVLPVASFMMFYPSEFLGKMMLAFLIGTPLFAFVGGICSLLLTGIEKSGAFLAVLVLPLVIPSLIFGISACSMTALDDVRTQAFYLLSGASLFALGACPPLGGFILRHIISDR